MNLKINEFLFIYYSNIKGPLVPHTLHLLVHLSVYFTMSSSNGTFGTSGTSGSSGISPHGTSHKYIVEGDIGAGKSTLLEVLLREFNRNGVGNGSSPLVEIRPEPVNLWGDLLDKFYLDKKRWSYIMQNNAFITRTLEVIKPVVAPTVFYERSVFIDRFCFAEMLYEDGLIDPTEWRIYNTWYTALVEKFNLVPDGFIYLRCDPELCMKRIETRGRISEKNIPVDYLRALTKKHDELFVDGRICRELKRDIPILIVDRNGAFEDPVYLDTIISQIKTFVNETSINSN